MPDDQLTRTDYEALVVGSGFGGAVAACRLAQAGVDVAVVERGRRWRPGDFPRDPSRLDDGWLWVCDDGLYDVRPIGDMLTVAVAGYGGGSLCYANVAVRPPDEVFADAPPQPGGDVRRARRGPDEPLRRHPGGVHVLRGARHRLQRRREDHPRPHLPGRGIAPLAERYDAAVPTGVLRLHPVDFLHQLAGMRATGGSGPPDAARTLVRFVAVFARELVRAVTWSPRAAAAPDHPEEDR